MKNLFTWIFFLIIVFPFQLLAQNSNLRLKKLHYENSIGEKAVTTFFYSLENKNYKAKWELLDGNRYSVNYHLLNDQDLLIRKYKEFSDSMTSNNFYKYDVNGNLIEDYFERSDKVKGIAWYKYENGRKTEAECRGYNGYFFGFIKYIYENDILIKGLIFKEGKETGFIDYKYDLAGNLIIEFWNFGNWNQTFTYEYEAITSKKPDSYTYSSPFLLESSNIKEEIYNWNNEKKGISYFEYEDNTKLRNKIYKYDGKTTNTSFEYDEEGLLMKSTRISSDGQKTVFYYHYNADRKLIRRLCFADFGYFGSESYAYDERGNLIEADWLKFDSWLTGSIKFTSKDDVLVSGYFSGKDGFNADLLFDSDNNKRVTKIDWKFTFNKTQTYQFKYSSEK
ncbi:MAG: hypothetical protein A2W99_04150 [Bacteroidetes bacterium GWF2_33_16]|nr:MAG: hypothetical protein A2X00_07365 [Bacteroidetes bacterium GWE2_32_14]OFY02982.1 MAG: hypothetical protein A2W99_04150 [Bacteroidetes bacterium GWF2_33_16]